MTTTDFYTLKDKDDNLVFAAINMVVLLADYGAPIPEELTENGKLKELGSEWWTAGEIEQKSGVDLAPDMKVEGPEGYGSRGRRRDFITEETFNIDFTPQEARRRTLEMYYDLGTGEYKNGAYYAKKRRAAKMKEYSSIIIGYDGEPENEIYPYWIFPKVTVEKRGKQSVTQTNALTYPLTLAAKEDPAYGALFGFGITGPGFTPELAQKMGVTGVQKLLNDSFKYSVKGATGGTYTISINGKMTATIEYNATAAAIQAAIRASGENEATVGGTVDAGFTITKVSAEPTVIATGLTGGGFPKTVEVTKQ